MLLRGLAMTVSLTGVCSGLILGTSPSSEVPLGESGRWAMPALRRAGDTRRMDRVVAGRAGIKPVRYRIVVRGELTASFVCTGPLEGLSVRTEDGFSVITGEIIDQSHLHGILDWLGGREIEIVSLSPAEGFEET